MPVDLLASAHDSGRVESARESHDPFRACLGKILVPLDFSKASLKALDCALAVAGWTNACVHLLYVSEPPTLVCDLNSLPVLAATGDGSDGEAKRQLAAIAADHALAEFPVTSEVRLGDPVGEITFVASAMHADLIVISTHGRTGFKRLLLGSVAEQIVRESPCPVLVVRNGHQEFSPPLTGDAAGLTLQKILVPIDLSPRSMEALHYAEAVARRFAAKITVVHSVHLFGMTGSSEYAPFESAALMQGAREGAERNLAQAMQTCSPDVIADSAVLVGPPLEEIPRFAEAGAFDLIICPTHGYTGLKRALLGSTAEGLLRCAPCPVLIVRNPLAHTP